jgi:hypothetical protein
LIKRSVLACLCLMGAASSAAAADDGVGVRTAVGMPPVRACNAAPKTISELGTAYYTLPQDRFATDVWNVLSACLDLKDEERYLVVVFTAMPTESAAKPSIIHVVLHRTSDKHIYEVGGFRGIGSAVWVYLTDDKSDEIKIQLFSKPGTNPLAAQIGPLAAVILPVIPPRQVNKAGVDDLKGNPSLLPPPSPPLPLPTSTIYYSVVDDVQLPFKRSAISESDFIQRGTGSEAKPLDGQATFANTPYAWLTLQAGVGVLAGKLRGATPAKIDSGAYITDVMKRSATTAGVALHWRFDPTSPRAGAAERTALVIGGVLTPAAGIYVGPSIGWRGFSFTAGRTWMWVQTTPEGYSIGDAVKKPSEGGPNPQLVYGRLRTWMIGGIYVFGK